MEDSWHVTLRDGKQQGPLSADEVRELIAAGQVGRESYCWRKDFSDWTPIAQVPLFADALPAPPPPQTPPGTPSAPAAGEGWDILKDSLDRGKRGALRTMRLAKLKMQLGKQNKSREELLAALGEDIYRQRNETALPDSSRGYLEALVKAEAEIAATQQAMSELGGGN